MSWAAPKQLAADQAAALEAAKAFAAQAREIFGDRVIRVRLYGSLARGDWRGADESEVDVAIILADRTDADIAPITDLAAKRMLATGYVVAPMLFSPAEFEERRQRELRLPREILEQGVIL